MGEPRKTYLIPNTVGFYPSDGLVALGRIITDPWVPDEAINPTSTLPLPKLEQQTERDFKTVIKHGSKGRYGIFLQFLNLSVVEGKLGFHHSNHEDLYMSASMMETKYFIPTDEYVEEALRQQEVISKLSKQGYTEKLYMIIGLKIARGAQVTTLVSSAKGGDAKVSVDGSSFGAAGLKLGPELELSHAHLIYKSSKPESDFVYAYRLREILYYQQSRPIATRDYTKGAAAGLNHGALNSKEEEEVASALIDDFDFDGVVNEDVGREDLTSEGDVYEEVDEEDGQEVDVIVKSN